MVDSFPPQPDSESGDLADTGGVAVIGMAGRFPGAASVAELWENLRGGVESITLATPEELAAAGVDPALAADPRYVPASGVLEGADRFDAAFFGFTPREAELLDPQHRVFLECAWEALEDAGYDPQRAGGVVGVFGGASRNSYLLRNVLPSGALAGAEAGIAGIAAERDFLTTRVSYKLDLKGPSLDVQTACSTSLVAVLLACQSLLGYGCDLALAGGVSVRVPEREGYLYQENGILSPDGHCRPFDAAARGTVPGSGAGVVVLKRLADALADGDTLRAVIRGAALNNDGAAKAGFTAPSVAGQAEVVEMALAVAGVRPREISYIEAHGTATPVGDPIEVRALDRVFRTDTSERGFCTLGSIKSNLGHLDAAAGVAGLIKTVLALEHREIPGTLHFTRPNPEIDLADSPFRISARLTPWETDRLPRRAGVSSFGIGGTNAHLVLEEAPVPRKAEAGRAPAAQAGAELLLISARTPEALEAATARLDAHLARYPELALEDVAFTLRQGRRPLRFRRARVGSRTTADQVATGEIPPGDGPPPRVAFLFPGQGAQHAGMAGELYRREPAFRREIDEICRLGEAAVGGFLPGTDLRRLLAPGEGEREEAARLLTQTAVAQPALFAVEFALARLWMSWGVQPAALLGHSLGEITAACLAGA
ncbi:MAG TPA: type I polyketide synthase, partial [Thermoanaerobaculia bacterium]|nr:type I polyketide synthase [Thermoanaerobaculia bacterium]